MIFYDDSRDNRSSNDSNSQFVYIYGNFGDSSEDLFNDFQKKNESPDSLIEFLDRNYLSLGQEEGTLEDAVERYSQNNNSTLTNTSSSTKKKSEKEKKSVQIFSITKEPKGKIEIKDQEEEKPKNELLGKKRQNENHTKFAFDNLVRKIKSKLFGALLIILNKSLEKDPKPNSNQDSKEKKGEVKTECFLKIDQKIILQTNIEENKKLLDSKLRDIFSEKVSTKAMNYSKQYKLDYNKNFIEKIKNDETRRKTNDILDMTFFQCLEHFRGSKRYEALNGLEKEYENVIEEMRNEPDYMESFVEQLNYFEVMYNNKKARKSKKNKINKEMVVEMKY
jgi:hypothetical protein